MRRSVRVRVTVVAVMALALVLLAASVVLVTLQRRALTEGIDKTLTQRADDVEALIATGEVPSDGLPQVNEGFVQVVAPDGRVSLATQDLAGEPPLDFARDLPLYTTANVPVVDDDRFRIHGRRLDDGSVIYVAASFDQVDESSAALIGSLAIALPILLAAMAGLVWWLVGRTLEPVEAIRAEVASFGSRDLHRRVPTSGTGDEIDRLAVTMNEMLARLEESMDQQHRFVADASHELRSPLTRLRSQIEVEMRTGSGDAHLLSSLHDEVLEMQRITEDLLYLARVDAGELHLNLEPLDLEDVALSEAQKTAATVDLNVDVRAVTPVNVTADELRLRRAVSNLLENAARHAESQVSVELRDDDEGAVLTVRDDGPGVPVDAAATIFERFTRVDESRSQALGGTGLGLAIAREIAVAHGGSVELINPGEPGAVFEMRLPSIS